MIRKIKFGIQREIMSVLKFIMKILKNVIKTSAIVRYAITKKSFLFTNKDHNLIVGLYNGLIKFINNFFLFLFYFD